MSAAVISGMIDVIQSWCLAYFMLRRSPFMLGICRQPAFLIESKGRAFKITFSPTIFCVGRRVKATPFMPLSFNLGMAGVGLPLLSLLPYTCLPRQKTSATHSHDLMHLPRVRQAVGMTV